MTEPPAGVVVITVGQIYTELRQVHASVTALHQKLEGLPTQVNDHEVRIRTIESYGLADHDSRIALVEQRKFVSPGALTWALGTAVVALGVLVAFLSLVRGGGA